MKKVRKIFLLLIIPLLAFMLLGKMPVQFPSYFPPPVYDLTKNPPAVEKIALGRALFFDPILSADGNISCASCHSPYNAFSHTDHSLSHGIGDSIGNRNAPSLVNLAWQKSFMWDGAINHLDFQPLTPISHPKEMGQNFETLIHKLNESSDFRERFYKAFGDSIVTGEHLLKALAQFQLTLISANSKYDKMKQNNAQFSAQEQKGYQLFLKNCNACHTEPLFTNSDFANNGLPVDTTLKDFGRWNITHLSGDSLKFKIPTLRNLSYTFPYMHDGRFRKLYQVLNHYTNGIKQSPTLSDKLSTPIQLSPDEKTDLVAFLLTLNDTTFVFNPDYQFPKKILHATKPK